MKYFAKHNDENRLIAIGIGYGGTEITKEEYDRLLAEIREKASLVNELYAGEITLADVPTEWQEEIQRRVDERIAMQGEAEKQPISAEEAMNIILGGDTE